MNNKKIIRAISQSYRLNKRIIEEHNMGIIKRPYDVLEPARKIVLHTENVVECLAPQDYYIIYNEVILGKRGTWYAGYLSTTTYYRHRNIAYEHFIDDLNR